MVCLEAYPVLSSIMEVGEGYARQITIEEEKVFDFLLKRARDLKNKGEVGLGTTKGTYTIFSDYQTLKKLILYASCLDVLKDFSFENEVYSAIFEKTIDEEYLEWLIERLYDGQKSVAGVFLNDYNILHTCDDSLVSKIKEGREMEKRLEKLVLTLTEDFG